MLEYVETEALSWLSNLVDIDWNSSNTTQHLEMSAQNTTKPREVTKTIAKKSVQNQNKIISNLTFTEVIRFEISIIIGIWWNYIYTAMQLL